MMLLGITVKGRVIQDRELPRLMSFGCLNNVRAEET